MPMKQRNNPCSTIKMRE